MLTVQVPVYEFNVEGNHVMRRRIDDWINATHILKVAEFDKPARTRILEREVQKGTHEKVQGGYGKYQGTWIPLEDGRGLAERNNCLDKLRPIFDFVPGDRSPPPAPKHATAAAGKPKPRQSVQQRRVPGTKRRGPSQQTAALTKAVNHKSQQSDVSFDAYSQQHDDVIPDDMTMVSQSQFSDDDDYDRASQFGAAGSRKRKRTVREPPQLSVAEQQQQLWADELLDYFVLQGSGEQLTRRPEVPHYIDLNRPLDNKGYTPLHWAAAMGDVDLMEELVARGARIDAQGTVEGETPLMRACAFTNNWDKRSMGRVIELLHPTIAQLDHYGSSVFHHIATSTCSKSRYAVARYYLETILDCVVKTGYDKFQITRLLDMQDTNGDTAVLIAARQGARKCVRILVEHNVSLDIPNTRGESADQIIQDLNARRKQRYSTLPGSSSPVMPPSGLNASASQLFDASERFGNPSKRPRYSSDAATLVASHLPTLITSRSEQLAAALDTELTERDREVQESERLLEQRRAEVEELQRRSAELAAEDEVAHDDEAQQQELDALSAESSSILRVQHAAELRLLIEEQESQAATKNATAEAEKLHYARLLGAAQQEREAALQSVIKAQALAGHGERQDIYRRLIGSALNIKPDEVDDMLGEIVEELEAAKAGRPSTAAGGLLDANAAHDENLASVNAHSFSHQGMQQHHQQQHQMNGVAPVRMSLAPHTNLGRQPQPVYAAGGVGKPVHVMG